MCKRSAVIVIVLIFSVLTLGTSSLMAAPVKVIYETDMCLDVDDVGALAMLHALANHGEAEILAVCYNEVHPNGDKCIDAINTWYGRGTIPIGLYDKSLTSPDWSGYLSKPWPWFDHNLRDGTVDTAVHVYKQVLAQQPNNSVTIVSVGFLNNLYDLLQDPEGYSLVASKVKKLVQMGGYNGDDFNLVRHNLVSQTQYVIENWPTLLVMSDDGGSIGTGSALSGAPAENPVRHCYYKWFNDSYQDRSSWDQVAALYAVRGTYSLFSENSSGTCSLSNGFVWNMSPGWRLTLSQTQSDSVFESVIEDLMIAPPQPAGTNDPNIARYPSPSIETNVESYDEIRALGPLTWTAGDNAAAVNGHHVYFGTDRKAVENREASVDQGLQTATSFDPGALALDTTYYWAIDEVNGATVWSGMLWTFSLGAYLDVDNMEAYNSLAAPEDNWIFDTWEDGRINGTGSQVGYHRPFIETGESYSGDQSMPLFYDNTASPFYSEVSVLLSNDNIAVGSDWTVGSPTAIELWFYGAEPDNDPETLYMGLRSSSSGVVTVGDVGDSMDLNAPQWHRFIVPLADFSAGGVDLTDIQEVYIGVGNPNNPSLGGEGLLFIDTIRLVPSRCLMDLTDAALDWNEDCLVDTAELGVFAREWLDRDAQEPELVLWLKLDETQTSVGGGDVVLEDSSGFGNYARVMTFNGNQPADLYWEDSVCPDDVMDGFGAMDITEYGNCVEVTNLPDEIVTAQTMTITLWWNNYIDKTVIDQGAFVEGVQGDAPGGWCKFWWDWEGDTMRVWDEVDDVLRSSGFDTDAYRDQWTHMALVMDEDHTVVYINGDVFATGQALRVPPHHCNTIRFGAHAKLRADYRKTLRHSKMDDLRIYNNALTQASIQSIMDCSVGSIDTSYIPLASIANLVPKVGDEGVYNPNNIDAVNFFDFAVIAESWRVSSPPWP